MSQAPQSRPSGNVGVIAGCVLLLLCFLLPWILLGRISALEISLDAEAAAAALAYLRPTPLMQTLLIHGLIFIPFAATTILWAEVTFPPGHPLRGATRIATLVVAGILAVFFVYLGHHYGARLAPGFWGSLMGALFITVGEFFNVIRNE